MSVKSICRDSPGLSPPTSNSSSVPAGCCSPGGTRSASTTPAAVPLPGLLKQIASVTSPPIMTCFGAETCRASCGFVASVCGDLAGPEGDAGDAADFPLGDGHQLKLCGNLLIRIQVPSDQISSPCGPCVAAGFVETSCVPLGISS